MTESRDEWIEPTLSLGIRRSSPPCFMKTLLAVWAGLTPTPSLVIIALVEGSTLNSSAAYLKYAGLRGVLTVSTHL